MENSTKIFLVTANIASCFEQPKEMLNPWLDEFFKVVTASDPKFIALHCQEVGGKNYETSMEHVDEFVSNLLERMKNLNFSKARIFIDEDFKYAERFTALGSFYFIHDSMDEVLIWDFKEKTFSKCEGVCEYSGNIEDVSIKEKAKFPQEFFPECKWSRKGFMRTRWCLNGTFIDLINIHLFHDASNFIAMKMFPSVYTLNRKRAMEHILDRFHNDEYENVPFFIFGDFNFRLDTGGVVQLLAEKCSKEEISEVDEKTFEYKTEDGKVLLSVSKKCFKHSNHHSMFLKDGAKWLRPFDKELQQFSDRLSEFPIHFPPTYPFEEGFNSNNGNHYMQTRCPSWCDRILLSKSAMKLVEKSESSTNYSLIGLNTSMGDHKPVGLKVELPLGRGTVECCSKINPCSNFVHNPLAPCFSTYAWCYCLSYPKCPTNENEDKIVEESINSTPLPELRDPACISKERECVCSVETNNGMSAWNTTSDILLPTETSGNLLKDVLNLKTLNATDLFEKQDPLLKRVHSDPIQVQNLSQKYKLINEHSTLAHSQSLDSRYKGGSRLRLRAVSSRLLSHHSSSTEEWFEVVNDKEEEVADDESKSEEKSLAGPSETTSLDNPLTEDSRDTTYISEEDSSIYRMEMAYKEKPLSQDYSLNNLLLSDSFEGNLDNIDSFTISSIETKIKHSSKESLSTDAPSGADCPSNVVEMDNVETVSKSKCCCVLF